jgi:hypothetical protein
MNIHKAIEKYKDNVDKSLSGEIKYELIRCKLPCGCIIGIKWDDMKFENHILTAGKNKYPFKLSMDLGNYLEGLYYKLIWISK